MGDVTRPHPIPTAAPVAALLALAALSQGAAAARLGVSQQAVSAAVARGAGVTLGTLVAWAEALGYVVEVRLRRRPPPPLTPAHKSKGPAGSDPSRAFVRVRAGLPPTSHRAPEALCDMKSRTVYQAVAQRPLPGERRRMGRA